MDREICTLGYIFGKRDESQKLIDFYDQAVEQVIEKVSNLKDAEQPSVFMEWSTEKYKSFTRGMSFDIVCSMAGGKNIVAAMEDKYSTKYPTMDAEWVTEQNPLFFVHMSSKTDGGYAVVDPAKMVSTYDEILNRSALANVTAVRNRDVYVLSAWEILDTPRFFVGLEYMAKILHPDLFKDLDPQKLHEEYLQRFQNVPYKGFYIYPQIKESK
jgi:iron complex transport system substrate-binding protein